MNTLSPSLSVSTQLPVLAICLSHHAPVVEAANRHVMERAFSFHIAGDTSLVKDCPRADSAIDFCDRVIYTVSDVFRLSSLRKLRRYCWSHVKREYDSHRSEHQFHGGSPFLVAPTLRVQLYSWLRP